MKGIADGSIPMESGSLSVREIVAMSPEFGGLGSQNITRFYSRLRSTRIYVKKGLQRAVSDKLMIDHDIAKLRLMKLENDNNNPIWHGSRAKTLLALDMNNEKHTKLKPMELYKARPEYSQFSLDVFRGHIYQELRTRKFRNEFVNRRVA